MKILIAIGGREFSKPTLDLGMKIANSFKSSTTIAYVGKKISQFSEKDVSVVHQNLDERELYRPGIRTLEWAYDFLISKGVTQYWLIPSLGATETYPFIGSSEIITDITSTGKTLADNNLRVLKDGLILSSKACLFFAKKKAAKLQPFLKSLGW